MSTNIPTKPDLPGFGPGQPSRTSIVVAASRAFGAREPDPAVRNPDWLAEKMLTSAELQLIREHPIAEALRKDYRAARRDREVNGLSNLMLVRTRYIDERLQRAIEDGVTQVVVLGAGFDTRAYRFQDQLRNRRIFEVDYRSTQEIKKRRLEEVFGTLPQHVQFIEIDFKKDSLLDLLQLSGYRAAEQTFFIWEGVSMYLSEESVRSVLGTVARSAAGSGLVMDFSAAATLEMLAKLPHLAQHKFTTHWGERWTFGLPDMREQEFFRSCGLEVREILSFTSREAAKRYLTRTDGTPLGRAWAGPPRHQPLLTTLRSIWMFLTRQSQWYALADLVVPPHTKPE